MNRVLAVAALLILPATAVATPAAPTSAPPSMQCAPAAQALRALRERFDETVRWVGRDAVGTEDVLTEAPHAKTWTLLAIGSDASGNAIACMLDSGGTRKGAAAA